MPFTKTNELFFHTEEPKITVNLFDGAFRHLVHPSGRYSHVHGKTTKYIKYIRDNMSYDGITLFTDHFLISNINQQVKSKYKIGWLMESRELITHVYVNFPFYMDNYDFILTHDPLLLQKYPKHTKPYVIGGCWIKQPNIGLHEKTKNISMIYSGKTGMEGHKLRHTVAQQVKNQVDLYGGGASNPVQYKEEALVDYRFSIVIENTYQENYITEKLIDSFVVGTIPIYWGCPNVSNFFDKNGIITFNTIEDLKAILPTLTPELYNSKLESIKKNFETAKKYAITEDSLYEDIFSKLS